MTTRSLREFTKYMTRASVDNTSARREATSSTVKVSTSSRKEVLTTRASGRTTKCKARANLTSNKVSCSTPVSGRLTSITDGEFSTLILHLTQSGFLIKVSSKMESSKAAVS